MLIEQAKQLKYRQVIYCDTYKNADGTPQRWVVTGKVKTWKRDLSRIQVPLKRGLREFGKLDEYNCCCFCLTEEEVEQRDKRKAEQQLYKNESLRDYVQRKHCEGVSN